MADDDYSHFTLPLYAIALIAVVSGSLVIFLYHWIAAACDEQPAHRAGPRHRPAQGEIPSNSSIVELIPAHKYKMGMGLRGGEDGTCSICLSEFEDGEELRTLPKCLHSYHVSCIDMWLYSHSSCPMCRNIATPSPLILRRPSNSDPLDV